MKTITKKYKTVDSKETVSELLSYIESNDILAYDVEATGINPRKDVIIGFSVSAKPGDGYYLPTKVYNPDKDCLDDLYIENKNAEDIAKFFVKELTGKKLCMHNGSYDCAITYNYYGISLIESLYIETLLLVHTVAEEGAFGFGGSPFALKTIAKWKQEEFMLDAEKDANEEQVALKESIKKNGGSVTKTNMEMYKADLDILCRYGSSDADLTMRVVNHFLPILKEEGLETFFFEEEVMPVYRNLTYPMELKGCKLDISLLKEVRENIQADIVSYQDKVLNSLMKLKEVQRWIVKSATDKFPFRVFDEENKEYKIKNKGKNAQAVIKRYFNMKGEKCPLPTNPKKPDHYHSIKKNNHKFLKEDYPDLFDFLDTGNMEPLEELDNSFFTKCSMDLWKEDNNNLYIKISSKKQLGEIVFDYLGEEPISHTDKGNPQFNEDFVESIKDKYDWSEDLYVFNRLNKIKSSYFDRLWENREGDRYYFNFKQHGTISGRYGSDAQQMPRPMEEGEDHPVVIKYSNEVRAVMIPDDGYVFIDADYESLEPHCVHEDSLIVKNDGISRIKDLKIGDYIFSNNKNNKNVLVKNIWKSEKEVLEVVTRKGVLRCSEDHKVFTLNKGWVIAGDLKDGDILEENKMYSNYDEYCNRLGLYSKKSDPKKDKPVGSIKVNDDWAWVLGAILGDGSFGNASIELTGLSQDGNTSKFMNFFKSFGIVDNKGKKVLKVPDFVFRSKMSVKLSFLAGIIDTDGTYNSKKNELSISSKSASFLGELITLCNILGLDPRLSKAYEHNSKGRVIHKVFHLRFTSVSVSKLYSLGINSYITTDRKKIEGGRLVGKIKSAEAVVLDVLRTSKKYVMYDIEVDSKEHDFICDNLRVHNCFSAVANDEGLKDIFRKGHDFYSTIAIATEKLEGVSADKKADNYLKKVDAPKRQKSKAYCLEGDTLVLTIDGYKKIKDIKIGDQVRSYGGFNKVTKTFKRKSKSCLVNTNRGSLRVTPDHKIYVTGKWVESKDLKKGDLIQTCYNASRSNLVKPLPIMSNMSYRNGKDKPIGYLHLDPDWAYFCGSVLGDGVISITQDHNSKGHGLKGYVGMCGLQKDGVIEWFDHFMNSLGFKSSIHKKKYSKKQNDYVITKTVKNSELCKIVYDTLNLGLWSDDVDYKRKNLEVPTYIFNSNTRIKSSFIAGLLDTDGYVKINHKKPSINICSKDYRLSTGLVVLLNTLGVSCSMSVDYNKTYDRNYYIVNLTREGCKNLCKLGVHNFMKCERKKEALEGYIDYERTYPPRQRKPQVISVEHDDLYIDVYDITVDTDHNFYANGILVHNCLGVPYGMSAFALSKSIDVSVKEAKKLIEDYLNAYPELRKWMERSNKMALEKGHVKSMVGRVRHLKRLNEIYKVMGDDSDKILDYKYRQELIRSHPGKEEDIISLYRDYKNGLNNAKNFQIQSLAASVVNRAGLGVVRVFNKRGIELYPIAQIHDQWVFMVKEEDKEIAVSIIQKVMETETDIGIDLKAPPEIAYNWRDGH